jgi:CRP/FNR family transcriptional regulator
MSCPHNNKIGIGLHASCADCSLNALCLPIAVEMNDIDYLDSVIKRGRPLRRNDHIFEANQPFHSLYVVRTGAIKTYMLTDQGDEQITGFYLPGELFGFDGMSGKHANGAKSLESTSICEVPFENIKEVSEKLPGLQPHLFKLMGQEIVEDQHMMYLLAQKPAEMRITSFLLNLSSRYARRKLSPTRFRLPMARTDIANYLGLAVETVSRIFTRLQTQHYIAVDGKEIEIFDINALLALSQDQDTAVVKNIAG